MSRDDPHPIAHLLSEGCSVTFYRENAIKAVRKPRQCNGCGHKVEVGSPALDYAGHADGDFWSATYHVDCRKAEVDLNDLHGTSYVGEWMNLSADMEWEDWPWLVDNFPAVAERMGITKARHDEIAEQHARF